MSEVARSTGLPVSTAYRLLTELAERQLLQLERDGSRFRVGLSVRRISASGDGNTAMIEDRAAPVLYDLAEATGCRIRLGVLARHNVAYIEKRPDCSPVTAFTADATLPTATSALGRVLLAYEPRSVIDRVAAGSSRIELSTQPTRVLRQSLAAVRSRQMAINRAAGRRGHCCFARPVFESGGLIVAALGMTVTGPDANLKPLIGVLTIAARSLSRELDGTCRPVHFSMTDGSRVASTSTPPEPTVPAHGVLEGA